MKWRPGVVELEQFGAEEETFGASESRRAATRSWIGGSFTAKA